MRSHEKPSKHRSILRVSRLKIVAVSTILLVARFANSAGIDGEWVGVYHAYPTIMKVTMNIQESVDGKVTGNANIVPLYEMKRRGMQKSSPISAFVSGRPINTLGIFRINLSEDPQSIARARFRQLKFSGVHDTASNSLVGMIGGVRTSGSPYFVFMRPKVAQRNLLGPATAAAEQALKGGSGGLSFGGPKEAVLIQWAERFIEEYPDINPMRTEYGSLYFMARNLFADPYFEPYFKKRYDELSSRQRGAIESAMRKYTRRSDSESRRYAGFTSGFSARGTFSVADITVSVIAHRGLRSWRKNLLEHLQTVPQEIKSLDLIKRMSAAAEEQLVTLWPSEKEEVAQQVASAAQRIALPVLIERIDQLNAAEASIELLRRITLWDVANDALLKWVSPEERTALANRVDTVLDEKLRSLMSTEVSAIRGFDSGPGALEQGNRWFWDLRKKYAFIQQRTRINEAIEQLAARRGADVAAATNQIAERIAASSSVADLDRALDALLAVPGDRATDAGRSMVALANSRKAVLDRADFLNYYSKNERLLIGNRDTIRVSEAAEAGPPNEEDIRFALLRAFVDSGGRWLDPDTVTYGYAFMMGHFDMHVSIPRVRIVGFRNNQQDGSCQNVLVPARYCADIKIDIRMQMSPEVQSFFRSSPTHAAMMNTMTRAVNTGSAEAFNQKGNEITHVFSLTPNGWKSPSYTLEISAGNLAILAPMWQQ